MSFLLKKDESLFATTTDLSTLLNKKDTIVEQRVDNSMLEVIFKRIEESDQPTDMGPTVSSTDIQPISIDGKQQQPLSSYFDGLFRDDNTPKVKKFIANFDYHHAAVIPANEICYLLACILFKIIFGHIRVVRSNACACTEHHLHMCIKYLINYFI